MQLNKDTLVTSSGVIRNRFKPRTGIVNARSLYSELFEDCINRGIDLTWESFREDRMAELKSENSELDEYDIENLFENESGMELDSRVFLYGAWVKIDGKYQIDKSGEHGSFALEYNTESGIVCSVSPGYRGIPLSMSGPGTPDDPPEVEDLFVGIILSGKRIDITYLLSPKQREDIEELCLVNAWENE